MYAAAAAAASSRDSEYLKLLLLLFDTRFVPSSTASRHLSSQRCRHSRDRAGLEIASKNPHYTGQRRKTTNSYYHESRKGTTFYIIFYIKNGAKMASHLFVNDLLGERGGATQGRRLSRSV